MSREWSNGTFSCFSDLSTCKVSQLANLIPAYAHFFAISFTLFQLCGTLYKLACLLSPAGILAYFCPCYVFGKNAEQLGESCVMYALSQFVPILDIWCRTSVRGKIREQKGIEGTCMKDLLCSWCCPLCSLVQEARVRSHASTRCFCKLL